MLFSLALLILASPPRSGNELADLLRFDAGRVEKDASGYRAAGLDDPDQRRVATEAIVHALGEYPEASLRKTLRSVIVVGRLYTDKNTFGGTVTVDRRSIVVGWSEDPGWMETIVHHEIGHLVMDKAGKRFPRKEWRAANPPAYVYPGEGADPDKLMSGFWGTVPEEPLLEQGFLTRYGSANIEEDWATYSEALFGGKERLRALINAAVRHPRVRSKALIASVFYRKTFPGLWPDVEEAVPVAPDPHAGED